MVMYAHNLSTREAETAGAWGPAGKLWTNEGLYLKGVGQSLWR